MTPDTWNTDHPIGTPVLVVEDDGSVTKSWTRSVAWEVCDGRSLVLLNDRTGGYDLFRITADFDGKGQ